MLDFVRFIGGFVLARWHDFQVRVYHCDSWPAGFPLWIVPRVSPALRALTVAFQQAGVSMAEAARAFHTLGKALLPIDRRGSSNG